MFEGVGRGENFEKIDWSLRWVTEKTSGCFFSVLPSPASRTRATGAHRRFPNCLSMSRKSTDTPLYLVASLCFMKIPKFGKRTRVQQAHICGISGSKGLTPSWKSSNAPDPRKQQQWFSLAQHLRGFRMAHSQHGRPIEKRS